MQRQTLDESDRKTFLPLEETFLSEELLRKAKIELNETEENREKCFQDLRQLISSEEDLEVDTDENFLLRFLRAWKYDTNRAFNLLKNYYSHRAKYHDLYKDFKPSTLAVLNDNTFGSLPYRNAEGCPINVTRCGIWDTSRITFEDFHRGSYMSSEKLIENEITQICGFVVIGDFTGFSLNHLLHLSPLKVYRFISGVQDSFPLRVKEVHVINYPKVFSILYALCKPFLSEKLKKRIILHGSNTESLHRYIDPSILPEEFGGELGPFDNSSFAKMLLDSEEEFINNPRFKFTNKKKL